MRFTANQKSLLNALIDKYERSKTYDGTNLVAQSFAVAPTAIWPDYASDFTSIEQVRDFETEMQYLQSCGLITICEKDGSIKKLVACNEKLEEYYELVHRKRMKDLKSEQLDFFKKWQQKDNAPLTLFCNEQLKRIEVGKKPMYSLEQCENLLKILEFILNNKEELLERELSIILLGDTKAFEQKYRSKLCKILGTYFDFSEKTDGVDDAREQEKIILEEFKIYANPSYVYLKGKMTLALKDGRTIRIASEPLALSSSLIKKLETITINCRQIVTVENLTSFHRVNDENCAYIYLAGYHNSEKQALLRRISEENPHKLWFHFGDIDPDGFYILEHLIKGTGIAFVPLKMNIELLKKYSSHCKLLTTNDKVKAENLIAKGKYVETLQYMLENNCKLEQEIVSMEKIVS